MEGGGVKGPLALELKEKGWAAVVDDGRHRSWSGHFRGAFSEEQLSKWWTDCSEKLPWGRPDVKTPSGMHPLPRSAVWLVSANRLENAKRDGIDPESMLSYSYGNTKWPPVSFPDWFEEITKEVCGVCGLTNPPDSCNANWYSNGFEFVGWHNDNERFFDSVRNDCLIISLSLGATRKFQIKLNEKVNPRPKEGEEPEEGKAPWEKLEADVELQNGDLCTMEGLFQKHYKHCVPKEKSVKDPRINLTWRWITRLGKKKIVYK